MCVCLNKSARFECNNVSESCVRASERYTVTAEPVLLASVSFAAGYFLRLGFISQQTSGLKMAVDLRA